jgi:hypothetical protein
MQGLVKAEQTKKEKATMSKRATPDTCAGQELSDSELSEIVGGAAQLITPPARRVEVVRPPLHRIQSALGEFDLPTTLPLPDLGGLASGDDVGVGVGKVGDKGGGVIGTVKF